MACPNFKNGLKTGLRPLGVKERKDTIILYEREMTLYLQKRPPIMVAYNNAMYYRT
jgi:hypothetical protein